VRDYFNIQWHITEDCNLSCKHCYQQTNKNPKSYNELIKMLDEIESLINDESKKRGKYLARKMSLTGGEPLLSPFFWNIIKEIKKRNFKLIVLTNGTLITNENAMLLKESAIHIQISLDGTEEINDSIRGKGSFAKSINALSILDKLGIETVVSFTANKNNFLTFYDLAEFLSKQEFNHVGIWSDRMIPFNSELETLNQEETKQLFKLMKKAKEDFEGKLKVVKMQRALQFLECPSKPYKCHAGNYFLTIMPNGDVYPCRRMPILVGNVFETPLVELYNNDELLKLLRREDVYPKKCINCNYKKSCNGGSKCLNFALEKTPFSKDIGCYLEWS